MQCSLLAQKCFLEIIFWSNGHLTKTVTFPKSGLKITIFLSSGHLAGLLWFEEHSLLSRYHWEEQGKPQPAHSYFEF